MKILYAEDEKQLSMAVCEIFKMENYDVDPVYDGEEALKMLRTTPYDIVVLDIMMPRLDGIKVLKIMRENGIYTPVLLLTAKTEVEDRIEGLNEGADDYLAKPFPMGELVARVNAITRRSQDYKVKSLDYSNIQFNCVINEISTEHGSLRLSMGEAEILKFLIQNSEKMCESSELNKFLNTEEEDVSAVELYIAYLRNKLRQVQAKIEICQDGNSYMLR